MVTWVQINNHSSYHGNSNTEDEVVVTWVQINNRSSCHGNSSTEDEVVCRIILVYILDNVLAHHVSTLIYAVHIMSC